MQGTDKAIALLMASFPAQETEREIAGLMTAFDLALEGIQARFVDDAVKAFIQGRVAEHNPSFRPRPAEIAAYARALQDRAVDIRNRQEATRLQLESRGREEPTPEDKARVQAALKRATGTIAEKVQSDMIQTSTTNK